MASGPATATCKRRFIPTPRLSPPGLAQAQVRPNATFYSQEMKEFFLLYDDVRKSSSPEKTLMEFLQSTYEAGANLAGWDRAALERKQ